MAKKILLGLTTTTPGGGWRNKVKEIDELDLKEIALFLTGLDIDERRELFDLLDKTGLESIPHVHLRNDMKFIELDYLAGRFKIKVFNVHAEDSSFPFKNDYKDYANKIFVENQSANLPTKNDLKKYGGLCLDLAHWESDNLKTGQDNQADRRLRYLAGKHKIGVNHISAIKAKPFTYHDRFTGRGFNGYDSHWLDDLSEVDYVKKYNNYLAEIISLELENPLRRQMEVKKYLEKILDL